MNPKGNPDIKDAPKPGPTSDGGKLRSSLNRLQIIKSEDVAKMPHIKPDYIDRYNHFVLFVKGLTGKTVNEILELENLAELLKQDLAVSALQKIEKGIKLSDQEITLVKIWRDTIISLHRLKYGTKQTQVNVKMKYSDIRDQMFKEPKNVTEEAKKHDKVRQDLD